MTKRYYWPFKYGHKSLDNKELQQRLGFRGEAADGIFGQATKLALEKYQQSRGFEVTGIVDRATEDALFPGNFERRNSPMRFSSNWLSGIVATTGFKYVLTMIATYLAAKFGVDQGTLLGILTQAVGLIFGVWGMAESATPKAVVDGKRVTLNEMAPADQAKVMQAVQNTAAAG